MFYIILRWYDGLGSVQDVPNWRGIFCAKKEFFYWNLLCRFFLSRSFVPKWFFYWDLFRVEGSFLGIYCTKVNYSMGIYCAKEIFLLESFVPKRIFLLGSIVTKRNFLRLCRRAFSFGIFCAKGIFLLGFV